MKIAYDQALPITARHDDIAAAIRDHQVVVVAGETGSGKTTQLPKIAYELGRRTIAHTQPRRIAARSVAKRIADECEVELGAEVGYAVRFDDQTSDATAIRLVTDGLLLAELQRDRRLSRYDTIIIDEAHERSLSIDFLLGYLKQLLPRRPDLKVIITSATIDVERFAEMFDAPGHRGQRAYVSRRGPLPAPRRDRRRRHARRHRGRRSRSCPSDGDILVFLSGEREIRDAAEFLAGKKYPRTEILPLYGRLAAGDQQKIFSDHTGRRIVLATNVAETSLTVPGIRYVIDPGFARISRFSQRLKVQRLPIEPISQASAAQRAGRCGRVADGICIRLYSEEDFDGRPGVHRPGDPAHQPRVGAAADGLARPRRHQGLPVPRPAGLARGDRRAQPAVRAGCARDAAVRRHRLTTIGRSMSTLPTDPRLARMLLAADRLGCLADVLVIVSAMSIQDPRERPLDHQQAADEKHRRFVEPDSDFLSWLTLWRYIREQRDELSSSAFRRMCRDEYLHYLRIREWHDVHSQLRRTAKDLGLKPGSPGADPDLVHQALLTGLLSHVGLRELDGREFLGARQAKFMIFPGSGLAKKPPRMVDGRRARRDQPAVGPYGGQDPAGVGRGGRRAPGQPFVQRTALVAQARSGHGAGEGPALRHPDHRRPAGPVRPRRSRRVAGAVHPARPGAGRVAHAPQVLGRATRRWSSRSRSSRSAYAAATSGSTTRRSTRSTTSESPPTSSRPVTSTRGGRRPGSTSQTS